MLQPSVTDDQPIRVLLVDDQSLMRVGFNLVLQNEPGIKVVAQADSGVTAIKAVDQLPIDVVLMDVRMPLMDGIEATRQITATHPETKVIVLTTFDLDDYAFAALKAGASGFLLKDIAPEAMVAAIRQVAAGEAVVSPRITRRMLELFAPELPTNDAVTGERPAESSLLDGLTSRERDVFDAIIVGSSNQEIAAALDVSETTIKTHVGNVLSKLGLRDRIQVVIFAYENGLAPKATAG
ncbi:MAG: response regulator transcription factor [Propionibacteriaceae bacterium]|jgi:DNA-binding NarL/FixJ family response regulator|nr:response regulator transcription factor [Propionibacteriaceae bacterium]